MSPRSFGIRSRLQVVIGGFKKRDSCNLSKKLASLLQVSSKKPNGKRDRQKAKAANDRPDTWAQVPKKPKLDESAINGNDKGLAVQTSEEKAAVQPSKDLAVEENERKEREMNVPPTES